MLRGHVNVVTKTMIGGWALSESDPNLSPEIEIVQDGDILVTIKPMFSYPALRAALKLPTIQGHQRYEWRFPFPLFYGITPNIPFDIRFRETQFPLAQGKSRVISLVENMNSDVRHDFSYSTFFAPTYRVQDQVINLFVSVISSGLIKDLSYLKVGQETHLLQVAKADLKQTIQIANLQNDIGWINLQIPYDKIRQTTDFITSIEIINASTAIDERIDFHNSLQKLHIPKTLVDASLRIADVPNTNNITRVSGNASSEDAYFIGGITTFLQLNAIAEQYFSKSITEFATVVDWGVGCGRVARHFWESSTQLNLKKNTKQEIIGFDIDKINVDWCHENMPKGDYILITPDELLPIESASVDFFYGISVMTHLSEYYQYKWLEEIRRVMKSGGCIILTVHGEYNWYRNYNSILSPFVEKFGFFDGIADTALGEELSTYYRASYHSRNYIEENWKKYFTIVDIIPSANAFTQDFVVLRAI